MDKHEWRKVEKKIYLPGNKPEQLTIPPFHYFMLSGRGNPNNPDFSEAISVLYSLSYGIKMLPKKGFIPEGYFDYTVYPLEGVWDVTEEAKQIELLNKDNLVYTIMIRQPHFVTNELALQIIRDTKIKKPHPSLDEVRFERFDEGLCVQMLHMGSFDDEPQSFKLMEEYCRNNNLKRLSKIHKEIYLSDFNKVEMSKLKTVLRFKVDYNEK